MKKRFVIGGFFLSLVLLINFGVFVSAQENSEIYCTDSDQDKIIEEKIYTLNTAPIEGQWYVDINSGEEFLFSPDVWNAWEGIWTMHVEDKGNTFTITLTRREGSGSSGKSNFFEKGEVYGKENILSEEFVTKEDFCVLTEKIPISELDLRSNNPEGKSSEEFGEGASWQHKSDGIYLVRCLNNDCDSARVDECEGDNCGVMEYGCHQNRLGGLSEARAWRYYLLHPIQFFIDYNTLFKKIWDDNQGFVKGRIIDANYYSNYPPKCVDGHYPELENN